MLDYIYAVQTELCLSRMRRELDSRGKFYTSKFRGSLFNFLHLGAIQIRNELERRCRSL